MESILNTVYAKVFANFRAVTTWCSTRFSIRFLFWTILVFCSRIPFLNGYGNDPDNWRILLAAKRMANGGGYSCTRDPCHPVVTIFYSWIVPADIVILNGITALLSAIAAAALIETIRKLGGKSYVLSGLAFAAVPVIYINSINTMDYLWALSSLLVAVLLFSYGRVLIAAVFIGIACGARFEYAAMLLPLSILAICPYEKQKKWWTLVAFWGISLCSMSLVFTPVLKRYGTKLFFSKWRLGNKMDFDPILLLNNGTFKTWGVWGVIGILAGICALTIYLFSKRNRVGELLKVDRTRTWQLFCLITITGYSFAFVRLPLEAGYLIPIVAFIVIFLSLSLPKQLIRLVACSLLLSPFILSATFADKNDPNAIASVNTTFSYDNSDIFLNFERNGELISANEQRNELAGRIHHALTTLSTVSRRLNGEPIAFIVGSMQPALESQWNGALGKHVRFYYDISEKKMRALQKKNVHVYVSPIGEYYSKKKHKFNVAKNGGKRIEI